MSGQVIKTYSGERAAQRGIAEMQRKGYEVDDLSTRKVLWSPVTGVFIRKQKHTIVFKKAGSGSPESEHPSVRFLKESLGLSTEDLVRLLNAHDANPDQLVELYRAGQLPEVAVPTEAVAVAATAATPEPAHSLGVADELAKLVVLRDSGVLTEDEFAAQKAKLLR